MKPKIAVLLLAVLLCLTTGCNNASHIAEMPDPISSSDSNIVPSESETAQAEKKTEVDRPQSTESQTGNRVTEFPASVSESATQPTEPTFDIGYWIGFAKSYAESIGLALDSGAVYCWDNPIAAGVKCKYTERDIRG